MATLRRALTFIVLLAVTASAQPRITTPKDEFGFNFGDDYQLATYQQLASYWHKLDRESDRMVVQEIGKTSEGRPHLMAIVTSPENHRNLARYKDISRQLASVGTLTDVQARALAKEGKAVVWIDGGLHASEVLGAQQLGEMVYQMVSRSDEETMRLLNDTITLFVHANPDGHDLVAGWYMRNPAEQRSGAGLPRLYHPYIGHDNNRDFFGSTQRETENINRVLYHEWFPQTLYNHHQSGPAGTVFWSPPFRDPFNYNQDPLLVIGLQQLGLAIHARLAAEGKPGASSRASGAYDGWWNGGIRNTATFHNILAILTEMIGNPTPIRIPLVMPRLLPTSDAPYPIAPQVWHFRQSIDYSITNNLAILDYASRNRESLLFNIYRMGKNSIERGGRDEWTPAPHRYAAVAQKMNVPMSGGGRGGAANAERDAAVLAELRRPELRDPRGYIIPSSQPDFPTAVKFVNALREVGIAVHRAAREFSVGGKSYPAGSLVVLTAQPFRPHVIDMFEPQDHPDNFPYPGAPPTPPYDNAGWTLAFQMGVEFDRILDGFTGPFEPVTDWNLKPPPGKVTTAVGAAGYLIGHEMLDSFTALNRLLGENREAFWLTEPTTTNGRTYPVGTWYISARSVSTSGRQTRGQTPIGDSTSIQLELQKLAADLGVSADATTTSPPAGAMRLRRPRIGLWDQYGGVIDSGWARWILEQFQFPFEKVFPQTLDAGNLNARYDVLVFVEGGIPSDRAQEAAQPSAADIPAEFRPWLGRVTSEKTLPQIRTFMENGGTVITIGDSSTNLARFLNLPIENHLAEGGQPLPDAKFYAPGSVLTAKVNVTHPIAHGMKERTDVFFDNSPVFKLGPGAPTQGVKAVAWFDTRTPLRSGWAWGQHYLENGVVAIEATVGKGRAVLFGPEILKRAQPHGTFKFLFNALYYSAVVR
jgi:Zinc carboxypeptidase